MARFYPEHLPDSVKTTIKETASHVKGKMDAWHTDRSNFAEAVVMDQIMEPLDSILENWDTMLQGFESEDKDNGQGKLTALVSRRAEIIRGLVDSMTPNDVRLTLENLAKMEAYGKKFADILMEDGTDFKWVENALRYVVEVPIPGEGTQSEKEEKIHISIANALKNPPSAGVEPQPAFSYACTLLAFAKPEQRRKIVDIALKEEKDPKTLITRLNQMGAVSPLEAEEFLGEDALSDDEVKEMGKEWEEKYDFIKRAKHLSGKSDGGNMANEMFTLTNGLKLFGYVAGSLTILLNGITHWKQIKDDPSHLFKIPQVGFGAIFVAAATIADSDRTIGEIVADKSTLDTWNRKKSLDGILSVVSASPRGWKKMLEGEGKGKKDYLGVKALAEFVGKYSKEERDLKEKDATLENFKKFLVERNSADSTKGYDKILTQLKGIEGSESSSDVSNTRFKKLAMAFSKLNIVGDSDQSVTTYTQVLAEAQGKTAPPVTATV